MWQTIKMSFLVIFILVANPIYPLCGPILARGAQDIERQSNSSEQAKDRNHGCHQAKRDTLYVDDLAGLINGMGTERKPPMNTAALITLMSRFLQKGFERQDAENLFGMVEDESIPDILPLQPTQDFISRVTLGTMEHEGGRFMWSIFIKFKELLPLDLESLIKEYGPPQEGVRLKPDEPVPFVFHVTGPDYAGDLTVGLKKEEGKDRMLTVQFTRLPPGW